MINGSELLKTGDVIGVVSCSDALHLEGCVEEYPDMYFAQAQAEILAMGFKCRLGQYLRSAEPHLRAQDFNEMVRDPGVSAIMFATGGDSVGEVIPFLDFESLKLHPKIIVGQSDISVLLNYINLVTGMVSYHGNNFMFGFGKDVCDVDRSEFKKAFCQGMIDSFDVSSGFRVLRKGRAEGMLVGGNLQSLSKLFSLYPLVGFEGKILFLETFMTTAQQAKAYLQYMDRFGVFDQISGLVIGYNYGMQTKFADEIQLEGLVMKMFPDYEFPVVKVENFGHCTGNVIIPIGQKGVLDTEERIWGAL